VTAKARVLLLPLLVLGSFAAAAIAIFYVRVPCTTNGRESSGDCVRSEKVFTHEAARTLGPLSRCPDPRERPKKTNKTRRVIAPPAPNKRDGGDPGALDFRAGRLILVRRLVEGNGGELRPIKLPPRERAEPKSSRCRGLGLRRHPSH